MKRIAELIYREPVVILSVITGVTGVLAEQAIIPPWVPLLTLAVVTPLQRALVTPEGKLRKISSQVRKELGI